MTRAPAAWAGLCLLAVAWSLTHADASRSSGKGSKWWGVIHLADDTSKAEDPTLSNDLRSNRMRGAYPGYPLDPISSLRKKQRRLARENQGVIGAVARGTRAAVTECQHQFRNRRWNCPTQERMRGRRLFGRIVNIGESRAPNLLCDFSASNLLLSAAFYNKRQCLLFNFCFPLLL
ncbi:Protein wingless [Amphibalanus amphitrite]|uniref:Protein Wnt n=1 Tax=Amphibalanus amphitrite TaxID=1232801 RepID=A0A6A4WYG1_AMPAM|nr:Protein wingless [Amphibalanus amphitrite]